MMTHDAGVPVAAREMGLCDRFHWWRGSSGRRYVFSVVSPHEIEHFDNAIIIVARGGAGEEKSIAWLGTRWEFMALRSRLAVRYPKASGDMELHVHLLAGSRQDRRDVIDDLFVEDVRLAAA